VLTQNLGGKTSDDVMMLESVILHRERLFTWGKKRQISIFPGVDVTASSLQGQTMQCSEKLQNYPRATSQPLQTSVGMLNVEVHDSTIRKRLNSMACLEGLQEKGSSL